MLRWRHQQCFLYTSGCKQQLLWYHVVLRGAKRHKYSVQAPGTDSKICNVISGRITLFGNKSKSLKVFQSLVSPARLIRTEISGLKGHYGNLEVNFHWVGFEKRRREKNLHERSSNIVTVEILQLKCIKCDNVVMQVEIKLWRNTVWICSSTLLNRGLESNSTVRINASNQGCVKTSTFYCISLCYNLVRAVRKDYVSAEHICFGRHK